jgi:hypothetical protein
MTTDILNTWKEIAAFLKVSVKYAKKLAKKYKDFPVWRDHRVFSTRQALAEWVEKRAKSLGPSKVPLKTPQRPSKDPSKTP